MKSVYATSSIQLYKYLIKVDRQTLVNFLTISSEGGVRRREILHDRANLGNNPATLKAC